MYKAGGKQKQELKTCSHEGCNNFSLKGGVCVKHGATWTKKTCSHEGCTNYVQKRGLCIRHGAKVTKKVKTCSQEGCTSNAKKRGLCYRHRTDRMGNPCTQQGVNIEPRKVVIVAVGILERALLIRSS